MDISEIILCIIRNNSAEESIVELTKLIESDEKCWEAFMERGRQYWKLGQVKNALEDYMVADRLHPCGQPCELLRHTLEIMKFRNTDLLNP
ncbi:MAG: hypothetical protein NC127_08310 [Muribaculum sp.]|nr:hypothetical protein [Muribaculum sp.]